MRESSRHEGYTVRSSLRLALVIVFALSSAVPAVASATPPGPDLAAVDAGIRRGQGEFNRGEFAAAARTWIQTGALLPETAEHRENRAAIYEYIADAYMRAIEARGEEVLPVELIEALNVLDAYAEGYASAYPGQNLPSTVVKAQQLFRKRLATLQARKDEPDDAGARAPVQVEKSGGEAPARSTRPWKGLAIGSGLAFGASVGMVVMFGAGLSSVNRYEKAFNDPENRCDPKEPQEACGEYYRRGTASDRAAVAGLVAAPVFLAAGAAMLAIALRRRSGRHAVAPALGPGLAGATWRLRF